MNAHGSFPPVAQATKLKRSRSLTIWALVTWALAVLMIGGIVHIASILLMPKLATRDAYARIAALAPVNKMVLLPTIGPGTEVLPFEDPALALGVCRYDLARGPVRLRGLLTPDDLVLMSFHGRYGQTFYAMTDRGASRGRLDVVIATRDQLDDIESRDSDEEVPQDLRLVAPNPQGFVLVRSLAERASQMGEAQARVASIACEG